MHKIPSTSDVTQMLHWVPLLRENAVKILIIYDLEKEKVQLAEALANIEGQTTTEIHLNHNKFLLPGSSKHQSNRDYNYIIFMLDVTRRHSFSVFEEAVRSSDINFFLGRSCFVTVNMTKHENACCSIDSIREIQNMYQTRVFHGNFITTDGLKHTACVVMEHIKEAFEL